MRILILCIDTRGAFCLSLLASCLPVSNLRRRRIHQYAEFVFSNRKDGLDALVSAYISRCGAFRRSIVLVRSVGNVFLVGSCRELLIPVWPFHNYKSVYDRRERTHSQPLPTLRIGFCGDRSYGDERSIFSCILYLGFSPSRLISRNRKRQNAG